MTIFRSKDEEAVYKILLQEKDIHMIDLAKKVKLHRPKVYSIVDDLIQDGLVEASKIGKRHVYNVTSGEYLAQKIENAKNEIEEESRTLTMLAARHQVIRKMEGKQDLIDMFNIMTMELGERGDYYSFTTKTDGAGLSTESLNIFRKLRDKKDLWSHVLTDKPLDLKKGVRFNLEIKQVVGQNFEQDCMWLSYSDKIVLIDYKDESGYVIKDARLARFQQEMFRLLSKKV